MELFEAIRTLRSVREFTEEPVSEEALLGIPEHIQTVALIPIGHPARTYGPPRRIPAKERTHYERWGTRAP